MKTVVSHKRVIISKVVLVGLSIVFILIKIASLHPHWVEIHYSTSAYPIIARTFRILFGWLPFSLGDLLYTAAAIYLIVKLVKLVKVLIKRRFNAASLKKGILKTAFIVAVIYISFNLFWGLNYNRLGIAYQLKIEAAVYTKKDLQNITSILIKKVNESRRNLDSNIKYPAWKDVFVSAQLAYKNVEKEYPFLHYQNRSVKRSLYGRGGNYFGFLGYYNPFTGEAQLNLTQPRFLVPYVTCHEMAHQLGYASEMEANFAGYLAAVHSPDVLFHYSAYFDLFNYANRELYVRDSAAARANYKQLDTLVKKDAAELRAFYKKYKNPIEPLIHIFYDQYLKANQQDKGIESYNYVVGLLIAYHKKYGRI